MKKNLYEKSKIITHTKGARVEFFSWYAVVVKQKFYISVIVIYISLLFRDYSSEFYELLQV